MADMTENGYNTMVNSIQRLHAANEVKAEFRGFIADVESRLTRILGYKSQLGSGDTIILQEFISTATAFYLAINASKNTLKTTYQVFLTGDDGEE